jgi:hypothetical protein
MEPPEICVHMDFGLFFSDTEEQCPFLSFEETAYGSIPAVVLAAETTWRLKTHSMSDAVAEVAPFLANAGYRFAAKYGDGFAVFPRVVENR